jgi:hypothetical protein
MSNPSQSHLQDRQPLKATTAQKATKFKKKSYRVESGVRLQLFGEMRVKFSHTTNEAPVEFERRTDEKDKSTAKNLCNGKNLNYLRVQAKI